MVDVLFDAAEVSHVNVDIPVQRHDVQHLFGLSPQEQRVQVLFIHHQTHVLYDEITGPAALLDHETAALEPIVEHAGIFPLLVMDTPVVA